MSEDAEFSTWDEATKRTYVWGWAEADQEREIVLREVLAEGLRLRLHMKTGIRAASLPDIATVARRVLDFVRSCDVLLAELLRSRRALEHARGVLGAIRERLSDASAGERRTAVESVKALAAEGIIDINAVLAYVPPSPDHRLIEALTEARRFVARYENGGDNWAFQLAARIDEALAAARAALRARPTPVAPAA